jgi:hypothetical protein
MYTLIEKTKGKICVTERKSDGYLSVTAWVKSFQKIRKFSPLVLNEKKQDGGSVEYVQVDLSGNFRWMVR